MNISVQTQRAELKRRERPDDFLEQSIPAPKQARDNLLEKDKISNSFKVLSIGDPHIKKDNLSEVPVYIQSLVTIIERENPNLIVILGDLLHHHEKLFTEELNMAYRFVNKLREYCPVYLLVGNHDYINNNQYLSTKHWMNSLKHWGESGYGQERKYAVNVIDEGVVVDIGWSGIGSFVFCPYVPPGKFIEALDEICERYDGYDWRSEKTRAIFCHQEFRGANLSESSQRDMLSTEGDDWSNEFPLVISGHIHARQKLGNRIHYVGSSMQHDFTESADKTVMLSVFDVTGEVSMQDIPLGLQAKAILHLDVNDVNGEFQLPSQNSRYCLKLTCRTPEEYTQFKKSTKGRELASKGVIFRVRYSKYESEGGGGGNTEIRPAAARGVNAGAILHDMVAQDSSSTVKRLFQSLIQAI